MSTVFAPSPDWSILGDSRSRMRVRVPAAFVCRRNTFELQQKKPGFLIFLIDFLVEPSYQDMAGYFPLKWSMRAPMTRSVFSAALILILGRSGQASKIQMTVQKSKYFGS